MFMVPCFTCTCTCIMFAFPAQLARQNRTVAWHCPFSSRESACPARPPPMPTLRALDSDLEILICRVMSYACPQTITGRKQPRSHGEWPPEHAERRRIEPGDARRPVARTWRMAWAKLEFHLPPNYNESSKKRTWISYKKTENKEIK